jgi:succinate dehydrogenase/fumarate reductase flavoprotein subunit
MPSGAKFVDKNGRRFLADYDPKRMEMTSRALLYFAVAHQKESGKIPSMDLREINFERLELLKKAIPIVISSYEGLGLDITKETVPYSYQVAGTAGIFGAGARISERGETSVPGLFAGGTCTDLAYLPGGHLPFCSVTGHWAGETAGAYSAGAEPDPLVPGQVEQALRDIEAPLNRPDRVRYAPVHRRLGELVMEKVGLVLRGDRLQTALDELLALRDDEVSGLYARDPHELAKVWGLMHYTRVLEATLRAYLYRTESRVAFIREDYPVIDNVNWVKMVIVQKHKGSLKLWDEALPESFHVVPVRPTQHMHLVFRQGEGAHAVR